ncbi:MAG: hypothetical protein NWE99_05740 [Candidatus Bathyarchaeota archaeon]|nr:hypothetical protein [Candidatus Bathyarchaeota archaeon]
MQTFQTTRRRNSGQVLIIAALIITMLLLSTALYVAETEKEAPAYDSGTDADFSAVKLGIMHTVLSALANISNGGETGTLVADLNQFQSVVEGHSYTAIIKMQFAPLNAAPYQNGIWIDWSTEGRGVSSAYVNVYLNSTGTSATCRAAYAVNLTSELKVSGFYTVLTGSLKQVNLTCSLFNEGKPALAQNFTVFYEQDGSLLTEEWIQVMSPSVTDYGNGTYAMSFTAETANPDDPMLVSVYCQDLRGILIRANATCVRG